jgi:hypothetical protein
MKATTDFGYDGPMPAGRSVWMVLLVATGLCLTPFFACVTPFAALATLAALKLTRRDAITVVGLVWLTNQAIGYGLLNYPRNWNSVAWGLAIGASSGLAILAASALSATRPVPFALSLPFVAAFAAFESGLYIVGLMLPGSEGAFSASVIAHIFLINAITLCVLGAIYHLAMMAGLLARNNEAMRTY